jgi:hypothetical protein
MLETTRRNLYSAVNPVEAPSCTAISTLQNHTPIIGSLSWMPGIKVPWHRLLLTHLSVWSDQAMQKWAQPKNSQKTSQPHEHLQV